MFKILHIIPNLRKGGAERLVLDICNELKQRANIQVKLLTFSNLCEYYELSKSIDWQIIHSRFVPSITNRDQKETLGLQQFVDDYQPDIIHSHLWEAEMVSRHIKAPNSKWFSHFHDNIVQLSKFGFPITKQKTTNLYERQLMLWKYKLCDNNFICISNDTLNFAHQNLPRCLNSKVELLFNAINVSRFANLNKKSKNKGKLKLVSIGSLVDKKNHQMFIPIIRMLITEGVDVHLSILGDGPNRLLLEEQIKNNNLQHQITLQGNVDKPEEYLWMSDIYVHVAYYEPFGLVLLEAMAAGLPVVALNGGGNKDILVQGKNGFMIFNENPDEFADKIMEIWQNKKRYKKMSTYAQHYAKQYDIKEYVDNLLKIYNA